MATKVQDLKVMGVIVGTCGAWDIMDVLTVFVYDFVPNENYLHWAAPEFQLDFEAGTLETFDDEGNVLESKNLLSMLEPSGG